MDRGDRWAAVNEVPKSWTRLSTDTRLRSSRSANHLAQPVAFNKHSLNNSIPSTWVRSRRCKHTCFFPTGRIILRGHGSLLAHPCNPFSARHLSPGTQQLFSSSLLSHSEMLKKKKKRHTLHTSLSSGRIHYIPAERHEHIILMHWEELVIRNNSYKHLIAF